MILQVHSEQLKVRTFLQSIINSITRKKIQGLFSVWLNITQHLKKKHGNHLLKLKNVGYHMRLLLNSRAVSVGDKHDQCLTCFNSGIKFVPIFPEMM